jgi:hypothetical protein
MEIEGGWTGFKTSVVGATVALVAIGLPTRDARAATTYNITSTSMADTTSDHICTFPEAIKAVNAKSTYHECAKATGNDVIQLTAGIYTAIVGLEITRGVTIKGSPVTPLLRQTTIINAANLTTADTALFYVEDANGKMTVTLQNLKLVGNGSRDESILVTGVWAEGTFLTNSTVNALGLDVSSFNNSGFFADGLINLNIQNGLIESNISYYWGGGISFSANNLTISQSTILQNVAEGPGGGIEYDGVGTSSITSSTISTNTSETPNGVGGGLALGAETYPNGPAGSFAIVASTFANNFCFLLDLNTPCGGGIYTADPEVQYNVTVTASIVAGNIAGPGYSEIAGNGSNVVVSNSMVWQGGDTSIAPPVVDAGGNAFGVNPLLDIGDSPAFDGSTGVVHDGGPFDLGGCNLDPSSPARDYLASLSVSVDERGFPRGISSDGKPHSKLFDLGAIEFDPHIQAETMSVVSSTATVAVVTGSGFSNGKGAQLPATKTGDNVVYYIPIAQEATYDVKVNFATGANEGTVQLEWSTDPTFKTGVSSIGGPVDLYAKTAGFLLKDYKVNLPLDDGDQNCFRFRLTGKNKSSSGYSVGLDYVDTIFE